MDGYSLTRLFRSWMSAHPHQHVQLLPTALLPLPLEADGEEIPPQVEVGADPQESFAQRDERRHVLDPVEIEMLQLKLVEVQQPPEEFVGGGREPTLVEVGKRHHVASGGDDESSSPNTNHSLGEVRAWRRSRWMRPSMHWKVMSERHH